MEALPGLWQLSPLAALVGMLVLQLYWNAKGTFVSKNTHDAHVAILQSTIDNQEKPITDQRNQITSLLEVGKTVQAVLRAAGPPVDDATGSE